MISIAELAASPAVLPIEQVADGFRVKRMDEAAYTHASFLDQRLLTGEDHGEAEWVSWADLRQAADRLPVRTNFIFHIGHGGSTLLSRLLGGHDGVFSLREPAVLRPLALSAAPPEREQALGVWLRLLSEPGGPVSGR